MISDERMKAFMAYARGGWRKGELELSIEEMLELIHYAFAFRQLDKFLDQSPDWSMPTAMPAAKKMCKDLRDMEMNDEAYDA